MRKHRPTPPRVTFVEENGVRYMLFKSADVSHLFPRHDKADIKKKHIEKEEAPR